MRIGVIGPASADSFADNIISAIADMGHDSVPLGPLYARHGRYVSAAGMAMRDAFPFLDERAQQHIATAARRADCELVINTDQRLSPTAVRDIRQAGIRVGMWFPDHVANIWRQFMLLA